MTLALSSNQQTFAGQLAKDTGLNLNVVDAWLRNEEPAISSNGTSGANNFLNVGITGNGSYGYANPVWNSPTSAADATAAWLEGKPIGTGGYSSTGYPGGGSTGSGILAAAKSSPAAQMFAIQHSGFASGGETALPSLYQQITGGVVTMPSTVQNTPAASSSSSGGSGSSNAQASLLQGGYIQPSGGLFSSLNPFNAIAGVWDALLGQAKYAGLFIAVLAVGALLIIKGISANGVKTPRINVIPVPA